LGVLLSKREVIFARTSSQVSKTGTVSSVSPSRVMSKWGAMEGSVGSSTLVSVAFLDLGLGLGFGFELCLEGGEGYGAERAAEVRRVVLGIMAD